MKVLNLKKEVLSSCCREDALSAEDWYFGCGESILNTSTSMEEARKIVTLLQFFEKREVRFDRSTAPFWHQCLQTDPEMRREFVRMILTELPLGGRGLIYDLRITAQVEKFWRRKEQTAVRAVLVEENHPEEKPDWTHKVVHDPFHFKTVLWDGPLDSSYDVPKLLEYEYGKTYYARADGKFEGEFIETSRNEAWSHGKNWLEFLRELYGGNAPSVSQRAAREGVYRWLYGHLTNVPIGNILLRDAKTGQLRLISADQYFDEEGKAYSPEAVYALRLFLEVDRPPPTMNTKKAIKRITEGNPIILVPAYGMRWNGDAVIHSSLLNGWESV